MKIFLIFLSLIFFCGSEVYFKEEFNGKWKERWVLSKTKPENERGEYSVEAPKKYQNKERQKGLKLLGDRKYHQISADIGKTISTKGKHLIFSYTANQEKDHECGGQYLKLLPASINQSDFGAHSQFYVMFGPDMCGRNSDNMQLIFKRNGTEFHSHNPPKCKKDTKTHLYTLIINSDLSYEVQIDNKEHRKAKLWEDFTCFQAPTIPDPKAKKPEEWDDRKEIPDPKHPKPDDWDQPMTLIDTTAEKPANWNEEVRGPWEPPEIPNPAFKGTFFPPLVKNPNYMGDWKRPKIPNPKFEAAKESYYFSELRYVGLDVWTVTQGTIFDNIFIGDNINEYKAFVHINWDPISEFEGGGSTKKAGKDKGKYDEHGNYFSDGNKDVIFGKKDDDDDNDDDDDFEL